MSEERDENVSSTDCVVHKHPVPPDQIARYSPERDPDDEQDIARYVEIEASDETVQHVERIKTEYIVGDAYEIWDVTTDKNRWWVISNLTNLYLQEHFPSLDYTLSFHVGLMMRLKSRSGTTDAENPDPFDEIFRRQEQIKRQYEQSIEAESFQSIGMLLRECLVSLANVMARRTNLDDAVERPKAADFLGWTRVLMDHLCAGDRNEELRQYMKNTSEKLWRLVNRLTHDRNANKTATSIAIHGCDTIIGHNIQLLIREKVDFVQKCPLCSSRNIRAHYDISIGEDGDYYQTCGECDWSTHPNQGV